MTTGHYTVQIFPQGEKEPVVYPDVVADDGDAAVAEVLLGWPVKREIRATTLVLRYEEKETGDA